MTLRKPSRKKQNERIEKEIEKWNEIFKDISSEQKKVADSLIEQAAFMKITLDILKVNIQLDGPTYLFEQGKQKMIVENPAQKSYIQMINRYNTVCNSLFSMIPKEEVTEDDDKLIQLLSRRTAQ